jgi:hypothetical protein
MDKPDIYVAPDQNHPEDWRVENLNADGDGGCEVAIFSGPRAEERARRFARGEYGWGLP